MDAFTRCDVCEMSPADTLYDGSPMCYDCRVAYAKTQAEMANAPKEPCIGCGADVCEDALCRDVGEYAEEVVRRVARNEEEDLFDY